MATSTDKSKVKGESNKEARDATSRANSEPIDFSDGLTADAIESVATVRRGTWTTKLEELLEGVKAGKGKPDTFYRIGRFSTQSGARTVIRNFEKNPDRLPGVFDLRAVVVTEGGKRISELRASVPSDSLDGEGDAASTADED